MRASIVNMCRVTVDRGTRRNILNIEEFILQPGELVAVVGPNGAGKSTFLQVINMLHSFQGEMQLFGYDSKQVDKTVLRRRCAMVFQDALLLNDTVFNNVALALQFRGAAASEVKHQVQKALADFGCSHLTNREAHSLSGGEAQRVCIARALVTNPELLLLDEPFASLDTAMRSEMIEEIRGLAQARGITVLLVSHNFAEVLHFAQRALVLLEGSIVQDDTPENVMRRPVNEQVARLVGMDNIIPCRLEQEGQGRYIRLCNGIRFLYHGEISGPISACCLPGDALYIWDEGFSSEHGQEPWVVVEGLVERIIPGVGTYRMILTLGKQTMIARIPRNHIANQIQSCAAIRVAFNPVEAHIV